VQFARQLLHRWERDVDDCARAVQAFELPDEKNGAVRCVCVSVCV
jgi:hypothetical protein